MLFMPFLVIVLLAVFIASCTEATSYFTLLLHPEVVNIWNLPSLWKFMTPVSVKTPGHPRESPLTAIYISPIKSPDPLEYFISL